MRQNVYVGYYWVYLNLTSPFEYLYIYGGILIIFVLCGFVFHFKLTYELLFIVMDVVGIVNVEWCMDIEC